MTFVPITGKCPVCHNDSANSAFQAGAASRDAEIHRLQMALADTEQLELGTAEKCDQLREQVEVLREALDVCAETFSIPVIRETAKEALAATEPKP